MPHALKNHPYSKIMTRLVTPGQEVGESSAQSRLWAVCIIVVKAFKTEEFRDEKAKLEMMLDALVEIADSISIDLFVNRASEKILHFHASSSLGCEEECDSLCWKGDSQCKDRKKLWEVKELSAIMKSVADVNIKTISTDNLKGFTRVGDMLLGFYEEVFGGSH